MGTSLSSQGQMSALAPGCSLLPNTVFSQHLSFEPALSVGTPTSAAAPGTLTWSGLFIHGEQCIRESRGPCVS